LQRVVNATARLVLDLTPRDHATSALRELHWLPIAQQIEHKLCLFVRKTCIGQSPDYIYTDISTRSSLRASTNGNFFLPRTKRRFGDRAFSVAVPRARNRLPTELKLMRSSTTTLKCHLKTFRFDSATPSTDSRMRHRASCRRRTKMQPLLLGLLLCLTMSTST